MDRHSCDHNTTAWDKHCEQFGAVCDVVYRTWAEWPLEHDDEDPWNHTSDFARAAAMRIFDLLEIEEPNDPESVEQREAHIQRMVDYQASKTNVVEQAERVLGEDDGSDIGLPPWI